MIVGMLSTQQCTDLIDAIRNAAILQQATLDITVTLPFDTLS
jgi:hypothetical protein